MKLLAILFVIFSISCKEDLKFTPMYVTGECSMALKEKGKRTQDATREEYFASICLSAKDFGMFKDHHKDLHDMIEECKGR